MRLSHVAAVFVALGLASCAFVLDFDELTAGEDAGTDAAAGTGATGGGSGAGGGSGGSSGSGGTGGGGTAGSGGTDGGTACASDCADNDPCTDDSCDETTSPARCVHVPAKRIMKDGLSETLVADEMHRVTMTSAADTFYYSVFEQTNGAPEISLYRLGANSMASEELLKFSSFLGFLQARSAGGLMADTSQGLHLHAFVGLGNETQHVIFDGTFSINTAQRASLSTIYDASNPRRHPVAMRLGNGEIVGAWVNNDNTVGIGSATRAPDTLANNILNVGQITPVASANTPGVLFTAPNAVYLQIAGGQPAPITQCNTQLGGYTSAASTQIMPGFWITSWTKQGANYLLTEGKGVGCANAACGFRQMCEGSEQATPGLRNPALATGVRPGDPAGTVLFASVAPIVGPNEDGTARTSAILLIVSRTAFGAVPLQEPPVSDEIGTAELARMAPVGPLERGPDWPAVSILPPNKIAVAWTQPAANGTGDELRVERYRICIP
jgi:hypothetical protein